MENAKRENLRLAREVLQLLGEGKLTLEGDAGSLPAHLNGQVEVIHGFDNLNPDLYSNPGFARMLAALSELESRALGAIGEDEELKSALQVIQSRLAAHLWHEVVGLSHDVGDNIEEQLMAFAAARLAFGQDNRLVERCLCLFEHGLWPFGCDEQSEQIYAFSCRAR